jgi:hypothetical protein
MKFIILTMSLLLYCSLTWASPSHSSKDNPGIREALNAIHDALENHGDGEDHDHDSGGFKEFLASLAHKETWGEWKEGLNFLGHAQDAYRAYLIASQTPAVREHALNLAFMFPLSHATEMLSGPIMASLSSAAGLPDSVTYGLGAIGAIISIPGLDPLCLLIFTTYPLPIVHKSVSLIRTKTASGMVYLGRTLGLSEFLAEALKNFESLPALLQQASRPESALELLGLGDYEYRFILKDEGGKENLAEVVLVRSAPRSSNERGFYYVSQIRVSAAGRANRKQLKNALRSFGWNLKQATFKILEEVDREESLTKHFYISGVEVRDDGGIQIDFKPRAIHLPKYDLRINRGSMGGESDSCERLFIAPSFGI